MSPPLVNKNDQSHSGRPKTTIQKQTITLPNQKTRPVLFSDVIGLYDVKEKLKERLTDYYVYKDLMLENNLVPSKGLLMCSVPGVGKTMLISATANELLTNNPKLSYSRIDAYELMSGTVGGSSEKIAQHFNEIRKKNDLYNKDHVLIIDEIDILIPDRNTSSVCTKERTGAFLNEMGGLKDDNSIYIIGATNRPDNIDTAFIRLGRFDDIIEIPPPNEEERLLLLERYFKGVKLTDRHCLLDLAQTSIGFTGSDIAGLARDVFIKSQKDPLSPEFLKDYMKNKFQSLELRMLKIAQFAVRYRKLEVGKMSSTMTSTQLNIKDAKKMDDTSTQEYLKRNGLT